MVDTELTADVVHLHSAFSPQNNLVARRVQAPLVLSPHGVFAAESLAHGRMKKQVFRRLFELPTLRRVQAIIALTDDERREAADFGYRGRIEVIPNGVAPPRSGVSDHALRDELAVAREDSVALFVGRIDLHHKRIDDVAAQVAATPGWHLAVVGPDYRGDEERLRQAISQLAGRERIHLLGPRRSEALAAAYAGSDVFTLLSRHEGMPMSLLEALSYGLPAVVSPEVEATVPVASAGAGWVTGVEALGSLLATLGTPSQTSAASKRARGLAADYRWEAIGAQYARLYAEVAGVK